MEKDFNKNTTGNNMDYLISPVSISKQDKMSCYIHIPFCHVKCGYCHFHSYDESMLKNNIFLADREFIPLINKYIVKLDEEISFYSSILRLSGLTLHHEKIKLHTVYMEGRTPSILDPEQINRIYSSLLRNFDLSELKEWTIECNPRDISKEKLLLYKEIGITRISLGIQSLNKTDLEYIGRESIDVLNSKKIFSEQDILHQWDKIFHMLGKYFDSFSIDLLLGLSNFNFEDLKFFILRYKIPHISLYLLSLEGNENKYDIFTQEWDAIEERQVEQYSKIQSFFDEMGYEQYEISNFSINKNSRAKHNSHYWNDGRYIGVGANSSGYIDHYRYKNRELSEYLNLQWYLPQVDIGGSIFRWLNQNGYYGEFEFIDQETEKKEKIMLNLRTKEGLDLEDYHNKFGEDFCKIKKEKINDFIQKGMVEIRGKNLSIVPEYYLISNSIISELI